MKDRIAKIIREEGLSAAKFADEIGVQASSISHILSGRNNPSLDFLIKTIERFRGINVEWLLLGKGDMYKSSSKNEPVRRIESLNAEPDLFSAVQTPNKSNDVTNKENQPMENPELKDLNQNMDNLIDEVITTNPNTSKPIDKIVILFKDKSFDVYRSNE
jgi:transcriptional regulator with XRE-family HTH domain